MTFVSTCSRSTRVSGEETCACVVPADSLIVSLLRRYRLLPLGQRRIQRVPCKRRAFDARRKFAHPGEHLELAEPRRLFGACLGHHVVEAAEQCVDLVERATLQRL